MSHLVLSAFICILLGCSKHKSVSNKSTDQHDPVKVENSKPQVIADRGNTQQETKGKDSDLQAIIGNGLDGNGAKLRNTLLFKLAPRFS